MQSSFKSEGDLERKSRKKMGITGFYPWMKSFSPKAILYMTAQELNALFSDVVTSTQTYRTKNSECLSLSLDTNQIVHDVSQRVFLYGEYEGTDPVGFDKLLRMDPGAREKLLFDEIGKEFETLVDMTRPKVALVISVDGPAPAPKLYQQKQRRYRGIKVDAEGKRVKEAEEEEPEENSPGENLPVTPLFDSTQITPGTEFMHRLDKYIRKWIISRRKFLPRIVMYSSHLVPGEGEHKITRMLRKINFRHSLQSKRYHLAHIVYGLDNDLVVIGVESKLVRYLVLGKDKRKGNFKDSRHYLSTKVTPEKSQQNQKFRITDASVLRTKLNSIMGTGPGDDRSEDFGLLTFLVGNDFLPSLPSISAGDYGLDVLIDVYVEIGKPRLVTEGKINWGALLRYITAFAEREPQLLRERSAVADTYHAVTLKKAGVGRAFDFDLFRDLYYRSIFTPRGQRGLTGSAFGAVPLSKEAVFDIEDLCTKWLSGLAWITGYYREGITGINPGWFYPYHRTPLMVDVARILRDNLDRLPKSMGVSQLKESGKKEKQKAPEGLEEEETEEKEEKSPGSKGEKPKSKEKERKACGVSTKREEELRTDKITQDPDFAKLRLPDKTHRGILIEWDALQLREPILMPFEQLVAVIPPTSSYILPEELQFLLEDDSPIGDLIPKDYVADQEWTVKDYQARNLVPFIDQYRIAAAVKCVDLPPDVAALNRRDDDLVSKIQESFF